MAWPLSQNLDSSPHDSLEPMQSKSNAWKRASMPLTTSFAGHRHDAEMAPTPVARFSANEQFDHASSDGERSQRFGDGLDERVRRESPVIVELKTNLVIKDETTIIKQLSYLLAAQFARHDSLVMVDLHHGACLAMGNSFEPCYKLKISTLFSQSDSGHTAFIQSFLSNILGIPSNRGIVVFKPVQAPDLAINGRTMQHELDRNARRHNDTLKQRYEPQSSGPIDRRAAIKEARYHRRAAHDSLLDDPATEEGTLVSYERDSGSEYESHRNKNHSSGRSNGAVHFAQGNVPQRISSLSATAPEVSGQNPPMTNSSNEERSVPNGVLKNGNSVEKNAKKDVPQHARLKAALSFKHKSSSTTHLPAPSSEQQESPREMDNPDSGRLSRMKAGLMNQSAVSIATLPDMDDEDEDRPQAPPIPAESEPRKRRMSRRKSFVDAFRAAAAAT